MSDVTPVPRNKQTPISFRSDKAARLLAELTRDGRSQAQVIEQALAREAESKPKLSKEEFIARIEKIVRPLQDLPRVTFKELDDALWDENGLPV